MDGPLTATWADNLNSALDSDKMLHLKNGDKLAMSDSVKLLFETDDLSTASPSTLSRCVRFWVTGLNGSTASGLV